MDAYQQFADLLLSRLVWTSIQASLLIGVVALTVRLLPRLPASIRCMLWWLISVQLVLGLCWRAPLELPLLAPVTALAPAQFDATRVALPIDATPVKHMHEHAATMAAVEVTATHWRDGLSALWLLAMLVQLPLLLRQSLRARRLLRTAAPLTDTPLQALCAQRARTIGLRRCPPLYVCADIASPQVIGLRRPVVLLPAAHTMTHAESAMALAHELAHLRRGDLWLGWLPAIARRLFFFHPLAGWAMREYAFEREAACDAHVLQQTGTPPHAYARLLLRLGVAHPVHAGLAGASPTFLNLKRRLNMLQQLDVVPPRHLRGWLVVALIAAAGIVPYRVTAGSPARADTTSPVTAAGASVPAAPVAPIPPAPAAPTMAPPAAPIPPAPPPPPAPAAGFSAHHVDIDTTDHAASGFALIGADSVTINGSNEDLETIKRLRNAKQPLLWFRRGDTAYIIRDKNLLARAGGIYAPVTELARAQGRLAGQQGSLAGQQAGLAARDASMAREQAGLARRQAHLAEQVAAAARSAGGQSADDARRAALDARQREMDAAQARLEQRHAAMESELAGQRTALESRQAEIEKQQRQLEQQQRRAGPAAAQAMSKLLDEAIAKGLAQRTSLR
jgi:beta-lactamase regulating signal transducer with metallopeptidase domain